MRKKERGGGQGSPFIRECSKCIGGALSDRTSPVRTPRAGQCRCLNANIGGLKFDWIPKNQDVKN